MSLYESIVERWFEDLFTRGDLSAVEGLVTADFVAYGTGGDGRTIETRGPEAFREWLRWYLRAELRWSDFDGCVLPSRVQETTSGGGFFE